MNKDECSKAFKEWRQDAMKDLNKVPNRWEAFYAGWAAAEECYGVEKEEPTQEQIRIGKGGT